MSRKSAVLAVSQLEEAAKAAVAAAVTERTVALTEGEARDTNGGAIISEPIIIVMGFFPTEPFAY